MFIYKKSKASNLNSCLFKLYLLKIWKIYLFYVVDTFLKDDKILNTFTSLNFITDKTILEHNICFKNGITQNNNK